MGRSPSCPKWGSPGVLIGRSIVTFRGVTVEPIDYYMRTNTMLETCSPTIKRKHLCDLDLGCVAQTDEYQYWKALPIAVNSEKEVVMASLLSGVISDNDQDQKHVDARNITMRELLTQHKQAVA